MPVVTLAHDADFEGWRDAARALALAETPPEAVHWQVGVPSDTAPAATAAAFSVPRIFIDLARAVICHSDPERYARLYAMLLRLRAGRVRADDDGDPELRLLQQMARAVQREMHEMRVAMAVEPVADSDGTRLVGWFAPRHHVLRANADYFARELRATRWSILTPALSLHRDGDRLVFGPGIDRPEGSIETVWRHYRATAGDPAGLAPFAPLPSNAWKEPGPAALDLTMTPAAKTVATQRGSNSTAALAALRDEAMSCRRCPLWKPATQTVFGEGPVDAALMFVGEQPGDQEDLAGRPFVGPAGQIFDRALAVAGIDRSRTYVTNAVKHFKFEPRGKRRIHSKPATPEIEACHWWIGQEMMIVKPRVTVALGATAARSLLGRTVTIMRSRGEALELPGGGECWVTVHPSYLLRIDDQGRAEAEFDAFVADLKRARERAEIA